MAVLHCEMDNRFGAGACLDFMSHLAINRRITWRVRQRIWTTVFFQRATHRSRFPLVQNVRFSLGD